MDILRPEPNSTLATVSFVLSCVELVLHVEGIVVATVFIVIFSQIRTIHINLMMVFNSFLISCMIVTLLRASSVVLELCSPYEQPLPTIASALRVLRMAAVYTVGLHQLLFSFERVMAAIRSRTYEKENNACLLLSSILSMWVFANFVIFLPFLSEVSNILIGISYVAIYVTSMTIMLFIHRSNLLLWRKNRGVLEISYNYQIRENVETSSWLVRFMTISSILLLTGWVSLLLYLHYMFDEKNLNLGKVFETIYVVSTALTTSTTPFIVYCYSDKVKTACKRWYLKRGLPFEGFEFNLLLCSQAFAFFSYFL